MNEGRLKDLLYQTHIIPLYSRFSNYFYNYKVKKKLNPNRWYFYFLPIKKNKIVFDSYLGKGYCDNPKSIAEEIINQGLDYDLVWLTNNKENLPCQIRQVKYGSIEALKELATAKLWVFNVRTVFHPNKRKRQIYLQTWHAGYVVKLIEREAEERIDEAYITKAKIDGSITDAVISSSSFFSLIYKNSFWLSKDTEILEIGTPKNDVLFDEQKKREINLEIRKRYSIEKHKKIVLYFPTFRNDGKLCHYNLDYSRIVATLNKRFDKDFVVLVRFHPNIANSINNSVALGNLCDCAINVTDYPEACELYGVADIMISDYSGVMIAFALQKKPFFIYAPDLEDYLNERGFNEIYDMVPCKKCKNNDDLVDEILSFNYEEFQKKAEKMFKYIKPFDTGTASSKTVDWIQKHISRKNEKRK